MIHDHETAIGFHSYASSKIAFTYLVQSLAAEIPVEKIQIVSIHPGDVYTEGVSTYCEKDSWPAWDDGEYNFFANHLGYITVHVH